MPVFKNLATVAEIANMTPEEYRAYLDDIDRQRCRYAEMEWAIKKATRKAEAETREKTRAEATRDHAIAFKKAGASAEMIATALNMSIEEVEALPTE